MKNIFGYSYKKFARTPFQGCKVDSNFFPGLRLRLTLGYMPAPLPGVQWILYSYPGLRYAHPGLHARTLFRGTRARQVEPYESGDKSPHSKLNSLLLKSILLILGICGTVEAEPWGKDADLVGRRYECVAPTPCATPLFGQFGETMIKFHQDVISPADGPRSNFRPSSSQYMLNAMRKYGFFKGFSMGCDRLMRENDDPWVYRKAPNENGEMMKWDPVP